jgi:Holliday junction resolvase
MNHQKKRFSRTKKPFSILSAAHSIVRVTEALDWQLDDVDAFLRRVHVEYGLSAEIEFAAILRWLGWCRLVHRLNIEALRDPAYDALEVPDLFAVFSTGDAFCSALIEVKATEELSLIFKKSYLEKLRAYARLMNQPLLLAWRPRPIGIWTLVDPNVAEPLYDERVQISFERAFQNDLMSILAGDYVLVPKAGTGVRIEAKRTGEKTPTKDGYEAVFTISDAYFHDANKNRVPDLPESITWAILSVLAHDEEVTDEGFCQSYTASGGMTRAQLVLRTAVGFSAGENERIHWKNVAESLDSILTSEALLSDAQAHFGSFMQYIFHQQPRQVPDFLPSTWKGRDSAGPHFHT